MMMEDTSDPVDELADTDDLLDIPETPEVPELPDVPDVPETPEVPEMPETHTGRESTDDPGTSEIPEIPEIIHPDEEIQPEELDPNSTYERNGYVYATDEFGRTTQVEGTLALRPGERSPLQTEVGHTGLEDDEGGHLIGTRFDGPTDAFNLVPQNANLNRGEWKAMENSWADALEKGSDVKATIMPIYTDDSTRPSAFEVVTEIDGELIYRHFENQSSKETAKEI